MLKIINKKRKITQNVNQILKKLFKNYHTVDSYGYIA